jgi:hypothetical protein
MGFRLFHAPIWGMLTRALPACSLLAIATLHFAHGQETSAQASVLDTWVAQLGSTDFLAREKASDHLRSLGPSVLPLLRKALKNPDAEVRKRAGDLVGELEKLEMTRIALSPRKVSLKLHQASIGEAVGEFSRVSGMRVDFVDPRERVGGKKANFNLVNMPCWEVLRLIKTTYDLRERVDHEMEEEPLDPGMWRRRPGRTPRGYHEIAPFRILLTPRPKEEPADLENTELGIRISLSHGGPSPTLSLHSQPDARILALRALTPRLADQAGKSLIIWKQRPAEPVPQQQRRGAMVVPFSRAVTARMDAPLELLPAETRSTILAGTAQIDLLQVDKPLAHIENLAEAEGKAIEGRDGVKLEVKQALEIRPGLYQVRFWVTPPQEPGIPPLVAGAPLPGLPAPGAPNPAGLPVPNGPLVMPVINTVNPAEFRFNLGGKTLSPSGTGVSTSVGPFGTKHEVTFTFQNRGLDGLEGVSVEWISQSVVSLDIPFEFRDVLIP